MPATYAIAINAMNSTWCIIFLAVSYIYHTSYTQAVKQTVFVKKGLTVDLSCPFKAATNPIIWRGPPNLKRYSINNKINSHLGQLDKISVNGNLTTQKYNLSISNFTTPDAGLYRCETILNETSKRHEIEVHLAAVSPVVRVNVEPSSVVEEGQNITLTCFHDSNTNDTFMYWTQNERLLLNTENRNLSVTNVSREDAGKYCCEVENRIGIGTDMINITVLYKPRVMSHSNALEIELDFEKPSFISFTIASGTKPNISSTNIHGGKIGYWNVQDIGEEIFNVSSTIFPVEKSHLGRYSVQVRNKIGSIDLNIEFVGQPVLTSIQTFKQNGTTRLQVRFISFPPPLEVIWFYKDQPISKPIFSAEKSLEKTGVKLQIKTKIILVNGYVTSYHIKETRNAAVGHYSCKVRNIIGNLDVSFSEPNITRKEGLRNNTSKTAIHWSIYVLMGVFLTVVVMIITISLISDRKLLQKYAKQGGENAIRSEQEIGSKMSSQSATCHFYAEVDYHAIEWRNFNGEASLPVNNVLTVKIDASFGSRDSEKTRDRAYLSENDVVTNSYLELL